MQPSARPRSRQAGFSFIEILVVMAIIAVLATMVVTIIPNIQERSRQTKSKDNVRNMLMMMLDRRTSKVTGGWPPYNGKNFVLSLIATNQIDIRNKQNLEVLFSPGDAIYSLEKTDVERYKDVKKDTLKNGADFHELTSYAGRRNADRDFVITPDEEKKGTMVMCDDDDGPLHHPDGLVIGYSNGASRFMEWDEIDMQKPDPKSPEEFLGDASSQEELQKLWGH